MNGVFFTLFWMFCNLRLVTNSASQIPNPAITNFNDLVNSIPSWTHQGSLRGILCAYYAECRLLNLENTSFLCNLIFIISFGAPNSFLSIEPRTGTARIATLLVANQSNRSSAFKLQVDCQFHIGQLWDFQNSKIHTYNRLSIKGFLSKCFSLQT